MAILDDTGDKKSHPMRRHDDHKRHDTRNGDRVINKAWPYILTAVIGGGGFSVLMPLSVPQLYRPDPATGADVRELRNSIKDVETKVDVFAMVGPAEVRKMLEKTIELQEETAEHLRDIAGLMEEMQRAQLEHFGNTTEWRDTRPRYKAPSN